MNQRIRVVKSWVSVAGMAHTEWMLPPTTTGPSVRVNGTVAELGAGGMPAHDTIAQHNVSEHETVPFDSFADFDRQ